MSHAKQLHNRRYFDDYMEIINRKGLPGNVKSELCEQVNRAVVGTSEALGRVPELYRAYRRLVRRLRDERPHALVLIDFPEFNLFLARQAQCRKLLRSFK